MTKFVQVPMLPSQLPQQKLYLVKEIPVPPKQWRIYTNVERYERLLPKSMPNSARFLGQFEWSWSPMHGAIVSFYISMCSTHRHWVLWNQPWDDNYFRFSEAHVVAVALRCGVAEKDAAKLLMIKYWRDNLLNTTLDEFHWINSTGILSVGDFRAVADEVWGGAN